MITMKMYLWLPLACCLHVAFSDSQNLNQLLPYGDGFGDVLRTTNQGSFVPNTNANQFLPSSNHGIQSPFGTRPGTGLEILRSPSLPHSLGTKNTFQGSPDPYIISTTQNFQNTGNNFQRNNFGSQLSTGNNFQSGGFGQGQLSNNRNQFNSLGSQNVNQHSNSLFPSNSFGGSRLTSNVQSNSFRSQNFNNNESRNLKSSIQSNQLNQFPSSNFLSTGLRNFESQLASTEDIHTDGGSGNSFGISPLSNDGINKNLGVTKIVPGPLSTPQLQQYTTTKVESDNSFVSQNVNNDHVTSSHTVGIPLPSSITGSSFSNIINDESTIKSQSSSSNTEDSFNAEPFGIPLQEADNLNTQLSHDNSIPPSPVQINSFPEAKSNNEQSSNTPFAAIESDPISTALNSLSDADSAQLDSLLDGLTVGELLMGINGQNGIVVLPMSSADDLKESNIISSGESEISVREVSSSDEAASATTHPPSTTRRPRRRRPTTKKPNHIRTSMSDLLYAKGQWFGTLLGGMIDFGRIAMDAFKKNVGSSSRDSYA